ncbi:unnamed protein product [Spirodela intermedia]|uniref:non-specific serine/threonine protein kinase n=1 Tax=Spirodela intermedia TaxID=51605 RepID=A0A7I8IA76_SPIIN|nr:unnamed protein product [Spirodela intermedia]CAA6653942.1 unnamed protein product [Spirodela intermedia]
MLFGQRSEPAGRRGGSAVRTRRRSPCLQDWRTSPEKIAVVYGRRRTGEPPNVQTKESHTRVSLALSKRISWNRDLSTRGRESIVIAPGADFRPLPKPRRAKEKNLKQILVKRRSGKQDAPDFRKERAYFDEVDAFELVEESPSPKQVGTWALGIEKNQNNYSAHDLPAILERWRISKLAYSCRPSGPLFKIIETPVLPPGSSYISSFDDLRITEDEPAKLDGGGESTDDLTIVGRESEASQSLSLSGECKSSFAQLLMVCRQSTPLMLSEVFSQYWHVWEAFKAGSAVCKIVPIDSDQLVNGEVQKRSEEVIEEVLLSLTLNSLRGQDDKDRENACSIFIETKDLRVCQGAYGSALINAWEDWDAKHGSENDHPKDFSETQRYIVFVLADGGRDLESFVLFNFDEARSLLVQGNILLARKDAQMMDFTIRGKKMSVKTHGLAVAIIDFTLSRINTGEAILFLDLSADPGLFEGPRGDRQSETYRKMREVTEDSWEGSFPKTNVLWLQYLVDILLLKKAFRRTAKDERELRSFKKRLSSYDSAESSLSDDFFGDLLAGHQC